MTFSGDAMYLYMYIRVFIKIQTCSWNRMLTHFTAITCDALPSDDHGHYTNATCSTREHFYNDRCALECSLGYTVDGDPVKTCQLDGSWNSSFTRCVGKLTPSSSPPFIHRNIKAASSNGSADRESGSPMSTCVMCNV